ADNKKLNTTVNNQSVTINNLKADNKKLNDTVNVLIDDNQFKADNEKLNTTVNNLKADNEKLNTTVNNLKADNEKLNAKIKTLKAIYSVSRNDVVNSLKGLSSTKNIQCGQYSFKLNDYLKIPLIKDGKKNVIKFKKNNGRLPKYVMIAGYKVPKNVYQKLYNL
ncbi:MAG: hypothetical protein MJ224_07690, partial [archaeon]|nr:hypothetical protein [archaeon]